VSKYLNTNMALGRFSSLLAASFLIVAMAALFSPLTLRIKVLGVSRLFGHIKNIHGQDLEVIPQTLFTEDLHYHAPSGQLFGASESYEKTRNTWFPPYASPLDSPK
jgi:hypothetical protein